VTPPDDLPLHPLARVAVEAQDIWFSYRRGQPTLRGVSLSVEANTICMLLGPSGSGKTTFLKVVRGLLKPQHGALKVLGTETFDNSHRNSSSLLGSPLAYIPQNLGLVRNLTVLDNVLTGALGRTSTLPSLVGVFSRLDREEALYTLDVLGIAHKANDKVYDLSGGERQRVAIARALMQHPSLVLGDEFVAHLDSVLTLELMEAVKGIVEQGVTFIISSHDLDLVSRYGDKAVFFQEGQVVRECPARQVDLEWVKAVTR